MNKTPKRSALENRPGLYLVPDIAMPTEMPDDIVTRLVREKCEYGDKPGHPSLREYDELIEDAKGSLPKKKPDEKLCSRLGRIGTLLGKVTS